MSLAKTKTLYEADYFLWIEKTVQGLKAGDLSRVDLENLIEEVEALGRKERRSLRSFLMRLLEHLLKRCYVLMSDCYRGWEIEIRNFRQQLRAILQDSPSLRGFLVECFEDCYQEALESVQDVYPETIFPLDCPFPVDIDRLLTEKFWLGIDDG